MKRVITFGEIMMRLNPEGYLRFVQADRFEATYAGGEANVAVSLANYGENAAFVSKVPAHEIGQTAVNELRRYGVDTSMMVRGGDRLGIYFAEKGASQRPSKVIYDRADSSMARFSCFLLTAASRVSPMISSKRTGVSQSPIRGATSTPPASRME